MLRAGDKNCAPGLSTFEGSNPWMKSGLFAFWPPSHRGVMARDKVLLAKPGAFR